MDSAVVVAVVSAAALLTNGWWQSRQAEQREKRTREEDNARLRQQRDHDAQERQRERRAHQESAEREVRAQQELVDRERRFLVLREFLDELQRVEGCAVHRYMHGSVPEGTDDNRLWYLQKLLSTVSDENLSRTTDAYVWRLAKALWNDQPRPEEFDDIWAYLHDPRREMLVAARESMS